MEWAMKVELLVYYWSKTPVRSVQPTGTLSRYEKELSFCETGLRQDDARCRRSHDRGPWDEDSTALTSRHARDRPHQYQPSMTTQTPTLPWHVPLERPIPHVPRVVTDSSDP